MSKTMQFKLTIKLGPKTLATVEGRELSTRSVRLSDLEDLALAEKYLERMFGLRFHIEQTSKSLSPAQPLEGFGMEELS